MLQILVGAIAIGLLAKSGVDKIVDVSSSVKENGVKETAKKEAEKAGKFVEKEFERQKKEYEKNNLK